MLHSVAEVAAVMWTLKLPPADRSVGPHPRTCGALPAIEHSPGLDWLAPTQVIRFSQAAGRLWLTVAPWAVPGALLLTVTVKPIGSPALTVAASAVLLTWMLAGLRSEERRVGKECRSRGSTYD